MPTITTFLTFNDRAEEAVEFYTSSKHSPREPRSGSRHGR